MTLAAFQGEPGAYSKEAALDLFGPGIQTLPRSTFEEVFGRSSSDWVIVE